MIQGIELLRINHAGAMLLKDGNTVNYGIIHKDDVKVIYYTGKGLQEIWKPNMTQEEKVKAEELKKNGEEKLIESGHIAVTLLDQIERVIF